MTRDGREVDGMAPQEGSPKRKGLRLAVKLAVTVLVTWFIFRQVGVTWAEVEALELAHWSPAWGALGLAFLLLVGGLGLHAFFWGRITGAFAGLRVSGATAVRIHFTANLLRYVPGKVWQLAGLAMLAQRRGIPVRPALGAAVVSQLMTLVGASLVGAWVLVVRPGVPGALGLAGVGVLVVLAAVACVPTVQRWVVTSGFRLARREPPPWSVDGAFGVRWILLHTVVWGIITVGFGVLVWSFAPGVAWVGVAPAYAAAYVLGYLAVFAPAGLGVREGLLVAFLAPVTGSADAVALSVIARVWSTAAELLPAAIFAAVELKGSPPGVPPAPPTEEGA